MSQHVTRLLCSNTRGVLVVFKQPGEKIDFSCVLLLRTPYYHPDGTYYNPYFDLYIHGCALSYLVLNLGSSIVFTSIRHPQTTEPMYLFGLALHNLEHWFLSKGH